MAIQAAFEAAGQWYRGNLHTHSSKSDAKLAPAEVAEFYQRNGYDFIALTDHQVYTDLAALPALKDFVVIPGIETYGLDPESGPHDLVGLGGDLRGVMQPGQKWEILDSFKADADRLLSFDMSVHFAHPYWSGQSAHDLAPIEGPQAVEVFNTSTDLGCDKGYSTETWDQLLAAGRRLWGLAVDDAHWLTWRPPDAGFGWVMVKAQELTVSTILEAVKLGRFYSTQGPTIRDVRVDGNEVHISCSPAATISSIGDRWFCATARGSGTPPALTQASFKLWPGQTYVRAVVVDWIGRRAWSNPIFLTD